MNLLTRNALSTITTALAAIAILAAPALMGAPTSAAQAQTYTAKNLGVLPGLTFSSAKAVNDRGQVVGDS